MTLTLVWAMSENGVIGRSGDLPWSLPDDLARFKELTLDGTVIMGRKTWDSLRVRPLPRRTNIVVSRRADFLADGALVVNSMESALASSASEAFCIGGAQVYALALPMATRLELTVVHDSSEGDVYMPPIDWGEWMLTSEEFHPIDDRHNVSFSFRSYDRT